MPYLRSTAGTPRSHEFELIVLNEGEVLDGIDTNECVIMALGNNATIQNSRLDNTTLIKADGSALCGQAVTEITGIFPIVRVSIDRVSAETAKLLGPQIRTLGGYKFTRDIDHEA